MIVAISVRKTSWRGTSPAPRPTLDAGIVVPVRIPRKIKALPLLLAGRATGSGDGTGTEGSTVRYGHSTVRAGNGTRSEIPTRQNRQNPLGEEECRAHDDREHADDKADPVDHPAL